VATTNFQIPPTWANPVLIEKDPATGESKASFNPVWLDWFIRLAALIPATSNGQLGTGNVTGPSPTVVGHLALWNNATGTLLKDGGAQVVFEDFEVPVGVVDGVNTTFTLAKAPNPTNSLMLFHKTGRLIFLQNVDYTLAGVTITTTAPPAVGDTLYAWYRHF
jgi:hypothetical protein